VTARDVARALARGSRGAVRRPLNGLANRIDPPVVILLYHRVTSLARDPQKLAVSPERFRAHLRHLKARHPLMRLEERWERLAAPSVAVTFDDGYADNVLEALPILEEVGVPATFFVTTGAVESGREFWWDEIDRALLHERPLPDRFEHADERGSRSWPARSSAERERLYRDLHALAKRSLPAHRERLLDALRRWAGTEEAPRPEARPMTVEEVGRLGASRLASVGAHGVTHAPMAALPLEDQREEMRASKRRLEEWLGREVTTFSYPFGGSRDFTRRSVAAAREAGFMRAAANRPGQVHRWTNPHALPRFLVRDWDLDPFARALARFFVA
jgi:peptidoglycan/xylan/chitin deacetylase (PgdA/CDA1 family)